MNEILWNGLARRLHNHIAIFPFRWKLTAYNTFNKFNLIQVLCCSLSHSCHKTNEMQSNAQRIPIFPQIVCTNFSIPNWLAVGAISWKFNSHYAHLHISFPLCDRSFFFAHFSLFVLVLSEIERTMIDDGRKMGFEQKINCIFICIDR